MPPFDNRTLRRVLVALDLSPASERIVHRAMRLPLTRDARVELFHVLPARAQTATRHTAAIDRLKSLQELAERAPGPVPPKVTTGIAVGQTHVEIIRRSRHLDADLVVLGHEAEKTLRERVLVGSLHKRLIQKGDVPVLVVTEFPVAPYRRPVVAVDLSDTSGRVVDLAQRLLEADAPERVSLVHAYHVPFEDWLHEDGLGREFRDEASAKLQRFHAMLGQQAGGWRTVLRKGEPRWVVLTEAQARGADLIVVGTHGRTGMAHALVGSVAEWVAARAGCDVAVTRSSRYSFDLP